MRQVRLGRRFLGLAIGFSIFSAPIYSFDSGSPAPRSNSTETPQRYGVFEEPLVISATPAQADIENLHRVVEAYRQQKDAGDTRVLEAFLSTHSADPWRTSLWLNVGLAQQRAGIYSDAIHAFEQAGKVSGKQPTVAERAVQQRATIELLLLHTKLGHEEELAAIVKQHPRGQDKGDLGSQLEDARQSLDNMRRHPESTFECGWLALVTLWQTEGLHPSNTIPSPKGSAAGFSLLELEKIAASEGHSVTAVHAASSVGIPVPSVVHLRAGHYATITAQRGQSYHVVDSAMGRDFWTNRNALDAESSGDYLVSSDARTSSRWSVLDPVSAAQIRGAGVTSTPDLDGGNPPPTCNGQGAGASPPPAIGMPQYCTTTMLVGLVLNDIPLGYKPPVGPKVDIQFTYNQQDRAQPTIFTYSNVGQKWTHNWISYITDDPTTAGSNVHLYMPGGYGRFYSGFNSSTSTFVNEPQTGAQLVLVSSAPVTYERRMPDGSKDVYSTSDNSTYYPRNIYWTKHVDPQSNTVTLNYDNTNRLVTLVDATGETTHFNYASSASPLLLTSVNSPAGRTTSLTYDSAGRLQSIEDAVEMTSSFGYDSGTFINTLKTPYGTTTFNYVEHDNDVVAGYPAFDRTLTTTDVLGHTSVVQSMDGPPGVAYSDPLGLPAKQTDGNANMNYRNTFFWDNYVNSENAGDYTKARSMHFAHLAGGLQAEYGQPAQASAKSEELESELYPLENRIWMDHPGGPAYYTGSYYKPSSTGRILADGSSQTVQNQYNNPFFNMTMRTDAIDTASGSDGRYLETDYQYAPNNIDVIEVDRYERNSSSQTPYSSKEYWTNYNNQHEAQTYVDEDGQTWTYTYNAQGQKTSETDPLGKTKSWAYGSNYYANGFLTKFTDENGNATNYTYDDVGRLYTETDAGGYTKTYAYDNLNRLLKTVYWDNTYEQDTYTNLDITAHRDRLGQVTQYQYDGVRNLKQVTTPLGAITSYTYYPNNLVLSKTDAIGGVTTWLRDIEGRVTERDDPNSLSTGFIYDATSRLSEVDVGINSTLNVVEKTRYDYDANNRIIGTTDPNGVYTANIYHARGWLQSRSVLANGKGTSSSQDATTSMTYSPRGETLTLTDPDGYTQTYSYDSDHRFTGTTDALGNRQVYTLDFVGNRTADNTYAFGSTTASRTHSFQYNALNEQTKSIDGKNASTMFAYDGDRNVTDVTDPLGIITHTTYDALHRVKAVAQNYNGTDTATANKVSNYGYDADSHLTSVTDPDNIQTLYKVDYLGHIKTLTSPDTGVTNSLYDDAGRLTQNTDARGAVTQMGHDALNRVTSKTYPAHPALNVTYTYDEAQPIQGCPTNFNIGHMTSMADESGSTRYCYSNQGDLREVNEAVAGNGLSYLSGYARTPGRRLKYLQYPTGFELLYGFDGAGRVNGITYAYLLGKTDASFRNLVSNVTYRPFGPVSGYTFAGSGSATSPVTRVFDANDNITAIKSNALNLLFGRDSRQNINQYQMASALAPQARCPGPQPEVINQVTVLESYNYDPLYRLKTVLDSCNSIEDSYSYNGTGDRLSKQVGSGTALSYGYLLGTHQLNSVGAGSTWQLDPVGNTTQMVGPTGQLLGLTYDDRNMLVALSSGGVSAATYHYNGKGERTWRSITSPTTSSVATIYDPQGSGNLLGEYVPSNPHEYVFLNGIPMAAIVNAGSTGGAVDLLYADHLGTVRAVATLTGSTQYTWTWLNNPFGEQAATGNFNLTMKFPGQYYDSESGLEYNGRRYYNSTTGRYLQSDTMGIRAGLSTYAYVRNNPLNQIDQHGLASTAPATNPAPAPQPGPTAPAPKTGPVPDFGLPANEPVMEPEELPFNGPVEFCIADPIACGAVLLIMPTDAGGKFDELPGPNSPNASPKPNNQPAPQSKPCDDDGDDECGQLREEESNDCYNSYGDFGSAGSRIIQSCLARARARWEVCKRNKGFMPPDAPLPWSDRDWEGWPTIHELNTRSRK